MKTGRRKPNVYVSVETIKNDLLETERLLDLLEMCRLPFRCNISFERRCFSKPYYCFLKLPLKANSKKETERDAVCRPHNLTFIHDHNGGTKPEDGCEDKTKDKTGNWLMIKTLLESISINIFATLLLILILNNDNYDMFSGCSRCSPSHE